MKNILKLNKDANFKGRTLKRVIVAGAIVSNISLWNFLGVYPTNVEYTDADRVNNEQMEEDLKDIEEEEIVFQNQELANYLKTHYDSDLSRKSLKKIKELTLDTKFINDDFTDLKYLTNLEILNVFHNEIDLSDIKYNQNLSCLYLFNCQISNTQDIPNTTYELKLTSCTIKDNQLITPFFLENLILNNTNYGKLTFKNNFYLKNVSISTESTLDLAAFKGAQQIEKIEICGCSNVINADSLLEIDYKECIIDEYSAIWMDENLYHDLKLDNEELRQQIEYLDLAAQALQERMQGLSEEEQISLLTYLVTECIEYDYRVLNTSTNLSSEYNNRPFYHTFNEKQGVCINYACLFQALANRVGIDSYQVFSTNHTWNQVNGKYNICATSIDGKTEYLKDENHSASYEEFKNLIASLDNTSEDYYYFDIDQYNDIKAFNAINVPVEETDDESVNIGYLSKKIIFKNTKNNTKFFIGNMIIMFSTCILLWVVNDRYPKINKTEEKPRVLQKMK